MPRAIGVASRRSAFGWERRYIVPYLCSAGNRNDVLSASPARNRAKKSERCPAHRHLSKGRPPWPLNHGDCGTKVPRPRNSSVPPCRPFKTAGSAPRGVPVRFWLGGRAATRRTFTAILQGFPGRAPCRGLIQPSGSAAQASARGQGLGVHNTPAHRTLAPSWPQLAHQLPGTVRLVLLRAAVGRRVFEETDRGPEAVCYEAKNRLLSKTSRLRSRW